MFASPFAGSGARMATGLVQRRGSAGRKDMWKHVVVSAFFWPPLEVRPHLLALSRTSVTPRQFGRAGWSQFEVNSSVVSFQGAH